MPVIFTYLHADCPCDVTTFLDLTGSGRVGSRVKNPEPVPSLISGIHEKHHHWKTTSVSRIISADTEHTNTCAQHTKYQQPSNKMALSLILHNNDAIINCLFTHMPALLKYNADDTVHGGTSIWRVGGPEYWRHRLLRTEWNKFEALRSPDTRAWRWRRT